MKSDIQDVRLEAGGFSRLLYVITVLLWIALGFSLFRIRVIGLQPVMVVHGLLVVFSTAAYMLRERLTPATAFRVTFLSALVLVWAALLQFGLASATILFLPVYPIITRITRGLHASYAITGLITAMFVITAVLYCGGFVTPAVDLNVMMTTWQAWALTLSVTFSLIIIFLYVYGPVEVILSEQQTWFTAVIDGVKDAVLILDAESGTIIACNGRTAEMLHIRTNLANRSFSDLGPPEKKDEVPALLSRVRGGETPTLDWDLKDREDRPVPCEISMRQTRIGSRDCIVAVLRNLTERRQAEAALQEKEHTYRLLFENMTSGVSFFEIMLDEKGVPCNFRYLDVNPAFEKITGWKAADVIGKTILEVAPLTTKPWIDLCGRVALTGKSEAYQGRSPDLNLFLDIWVYSTGGGRFVVQFSDITEKMKMHETLQRTQKLESLGLLAGGIAHDFNNLLGGIYGAIELARLHLAEQHPEEAAAKLADSLATYKRAKALTHQLLTFSKGGQPIRKTCQLEPLLKNCGRFALAGSAVNCVFNISESLWMSDIDENQIGQVIENLVINAQQAMPEGGTIDIGASNVDLEPGKVAMHPEGGKYIRIVVTDSGTGIPNEMLPRIFDPFFTTKQKGHGLGLATVHSIVNRHQGWIEVESEPGRGSSFTIYLPASGHQEKAADTPIVQNAVTADGSVLFLDDEEFLHAIANKMFASFGLSFTGVKDGKEAVAVFRESVEHGRPFDLVVLDLTISGGAGGREIIQELRGIRSETVFIASSGYSVDPIMADPPAFGFDGGLPKPYSLDDVKALLARFLPKQA
ncbi:PAS domain S-box protein [Candidatus Ozemobacteraceae bacterium]|nr:PAS domain S-box protein [Candidatus Ozemobacteraceae bacterium]